MSFNLLHCAWLRGGVAVKIFLAVVAMQVSWMGVFGGWIAGGI